MRVRKMLVYPHLYLIYMINGSSIFNYLIILSNVIDIYYLALNKLLCADSVQINSLLSTTIDEFDYSTPLSNITNVDWSSTLHVEKSVCGHKIVKIMIY